MRILKKFVEKIIWNDLLFYVRVQIFVEWAVGSFVKSKLPSNSP